MRSTCLRRRWARLLPTCLAAILLVVGAGASAAPGTSPPPADLPALRASALTAHNEYRQRHGSPSMALDDVLNDTAQAWADQIAASGALAHSPPNRRNDAGENIFVSFSGEDEDMGALASAGVKSWYDEIKSYDFANPGFGSQTAHFTQLVWRSSTKLGAGAARGTITVGGRKYDAVYMVCHYFPAGNILTQFPANVPAGGAAAQPGAPARSQPRSSASAASPSITEVSFKETPADGQAVAVLTLFTPQTEGGLAVEVNGRQVAPPLEVLARPDKGFVRLKGSRRDLNLVKGDNAVVLVVDGVRSAPARFVY